MHNYQCSILPWLPRFKNVYSHSPSNIFNPQIRDCECPVVLLGLSRVLVVYSAGEMSLPSTMISPEPDGTSGCRVSPCDSSSSSNNSTNSTNYTTFHSFPRLPWEIRAVIWEMAITERHVPIYIRGRRHWFSWKYRQWPKDAKLLFTSAPIPPALHACHEARTHLIHPSTQGHYEKMSAFHLCNNQQPFAWELNKEKWPAPTPYIWVNFHVDLIDLRDQDFKLNVPPNKDNYASKFKRIMFEPCEARHPSESARVFQALMPKSPYGFPNVEYAGINVTRYMESLSQWVQGLKVPVNELACRLENVCCVRTAPDVREAATLKEVMWRYCDKTDELLEYFAPELEYLSVREAKERVR
ncbi:hypothetical protein B0T20DRAFT_410511 [Sordaria brevicollis]|uniref:2EXR domain-containing protein n=1 Tax=Sordaria brevicollis TaxID=83679 RepID=A0AAE0PDY2_SORBR|nr:hypothetical protein B0T20DRAFT_410511 [Sordaria brevicollis]